MKRLLLLITLLFTLTGCLDTFVGSAEAVATCQEDTCTISFAPPEAGTYTFRAAAESLEYLGGSGCDEERRFDEVGLQVITLLCRDVTPSSGTYVVLKGADQSAAFRSLLGTAEYRVSYP